MSDNTPDDSGAPTGDAAVKRVRKPRVAKKPADTASDTPPQPQLQLPSQDAAAPRPQAQAPEPLCFCWNDGRKIAEGHIACIRTNQGRRMALCGRVINMMSWQVTENPCPES